MEINQQDKMATRTGLEPVHRHSVSGLHPEIAEIPRVSGKDKGQTDGAKGRPLVRKLVKGKGGIEKGAKIRTARIAKMMRDGDQRTPEYLALLAEVGGLLPGRHAGLLQEAVEVAVGLDAVSTLAAIAGLLAAHIDAARMGANGKVCCTCKELRPLLDFYKDATRKGGYSSRCAGCSLKLSHAWQSKNQEKVSAQKQVADAIRTGILVREPCEVCGNADADGHHDDYTKPLSVRWLCPSHHRQHHADQAKEARRAASRGASV